MKAGVKSNRIREIIVQKRDLTHNIHVTKEKITKSKKDKNSGKKVLLP